MNKFTDLHIGLSDAIVIMKNDPFVRSECTGLFPNQFDLERAREGNLKCFISFMCPIKFKNNIFVLPKNVFREIEKHLGVLNKLQKHIENNNFDMKIHVGLEGLHFIKIEQDLDKLRLFVKKGVRFVGLKWEFESPLFENNKLTNLGIEALKVLEEEKVVVDLAHSEEGLWQDILRNFKGRVMDSHTNCFAVNPHRRNATNELIKEIINRDGIIGMTFMSSLIGGSSLDDLSKHTDHFINNFGTDHLCIGSDFDGMKNTSVMNDLEDVSKYVNFQKVLKNIDMEEKNIRKICSENANRFLKLL